jgi:predicted NUDIX family phosphoesterase
MVMRDEAVLGIPHAHFFAWGAFTGFREASSAQIASLLDPNHFEFRWRSQCEIDSTFLQLIPYVILRSQEQCFHYRRGASGTETRLQTLRSIGIGGHISEADAHGGSDPYLTGLEREVHEEVQLSDVLTKSCLGLIYDPRTPVGEVHLGVVHLWELAAPKAQPRESAIAGAGWERITRLREEAAEFETWSQFVLETLSG